MADSEATCIPHDINCAVSTLDTPALFTEKGYGLVTVQLACANFACWKNMMVQAKSKCWKNG